MKRHTHLWSLALYGAVCVTSNGDEIGQDPGNGIDKLSEVQLRKLVVDLYDQYERLEQAHHQLIAESKETWSEHRELELRVRKLEEFKSKSKDAYSRIWRAIWQFREKAVDDRIEQDNFKEVERAFAFMMADLADGEEKYRKCVLLVNRERTTVWIHLGKDDGVTVGSKLAVYRDVIAPDKKKGVIEVTEVLQGNLSEAKILERTGSFGIGLSDPLELISKPAKAGDDQPNPKGNQTKNGAAN